MRELNISRAAEADVLETWAYVFEQQSEVAADRVVDKIQAQFHSLLTFPTMGRNRGDLRLGLRGIAVGNYNIFYRILPDGIEIVRVLHSARNLADVFPPEEEE